MKPTQRYGYNDPEMVPYRPKFTAARAIGVFFALLLIVGVWMALDAKLLFGSDWLSPTYDRQDWRTAGGDQSTYGAWDLETHIWKTEFVMEHFPNFQWNPYWYLGMPLFKYYQFGYYIANAGLALALGVSAARASILLIIFGHLLATVLTFALAYKFSRRIWLSAIASLFVLSNTFISLRSYGWEPITVVFLWLYPLGLLLFFKEPLRPFRFGLILVMAAAYYSHPLIFFALAMTMGLYLFSIAIRKHLSNEAKQRHYIWQYFGMVLVSLGIGAVQFFLHMSYSQVTSGAHMGVKYLPYYQVPFNIISFTDFMLDAANLRGPGFVIMIATVLFFMFTIYALRTRDERLPNIFKHPAAAGLSFVVAMMVLFYYASLWNVFPMNILRSIQYHRIIPEFIITAVALVAVMVNLVRTRVQQVMYYSIVVAFAIASMMVVYHVQLEWHTTPTIMDSEEFIHEEFTGRFSNPYPQQSLAVRNSFLNHHQVYGYYEQGVTNSYADELFSVSSGFHNAELTVLYLKAANVERLYTNNQVEGRDAAVRSRLNGTLEYVWDGQSRYGYFAVPLTDPSYAQAVSATAAGEVAALEPGCRVLFQVEYCGSVGQEFVSNDPEEVRFLRAYVDLLETPHPAEAQYVMVNPDHYQVRVSGADSDTAVVVKMTYDRDFEATVNGHQVPIEKFGPDFMLIQPGLSSAYTIDLVYRTPREALVGLGVSAATLFLTVLYFVAGKPATTPRRLRFPIGDMK
jgi:hypothetical protein